MRILIVEDERRLADLIRQGLVEQGHAADIAETGDDALYLARTADYDVIVLDVMLPDISGLDVCRTLRREGRAVPILLLTARDSIEDRVAGLDCGADDYLIKPFALAELSARLRALTRRPAPLHATVLTWQRLRLDPANREVWKDEARVSTLR